MRFGGNISRTASFIGMERSALHRKLKSLGVGSGRVDEAEGLSGAPDLGPLGVLAPGYAAEGAPVRLEAELRGGGEADGGAPRGTREKCLVEAPAAVGADERGRGVRRGPLAASPGCLEWVGVGGGPTP
jgi:hypothetical protein